jgi:hypothetical protein
MTPTTGPGGDATRPPSCISMNSGAAIVSGPSCERRVLVEIRD